MEVGTNQKYRIANIDIIMRVSVILQMYHPNWDKIRLTLDSILLQTGIDYELIVSDDGSETDYFDDIRDYLNSREYKHPLKFAKCLSNVGTVKALHNALMQHATGEYIRFISPGDLLHGNTALRDWVNFAREQEAVVAFTELIYYQMNESKEITPVQQWVSPQYNRYKNQADFLKHYVMYNDVSIGFGILYRTTELKRYLSAFVDRVKYAEDNVARVMIFAGEKAAYYPKPTGLYEVDTGISTSDVWRQRLINDWNASTAVMRRMNPDEGLYNYFYQANRYNFSNNMIKKVLSYISMPGKFIWYVLDTVKPRMSCMDIDMEYINELRDY